MVECYCCSGFGVVLLDLLFICGCGFGLVFAWVVGFAVLFLVGRALCVPVCGSFTGLGFSVLMLLWFVGFMVCCFRLLCLIMLVLLLNLWLV